MRSWREPAGEGGQSQRRDLDDGLDDDGAAHLRRSLCPVGEGDRHLLDPKALSDRAVGHLDLERVALRVDGLEIDRLEHGAPEALEPARQVVNGESEQHARVERASPRDDPPDDSPVPSAAAVHVPRAERDVGTAVARRDEPWNVGRVVREVAVHLEDQVGVGAECVSEGGEVGGTEPFLAGSMQHGDVVELRREPVGDLAGAVRGVVVDHEDADAVRAERVHHVLEVLALVVRRQADGRNRHGKTKGKVATPAASSTADTA
jgi:hypothetical protein